MRQRHVDGTKRSLRITTLVAVLSCAGSHLLSPAHALDEIFRQTDVDLSGEAQLLKNPSFDHGDLVPTEDGTGMQLPEWDFWQDGYVVVPGAGRGGTRAIQCTITEENLGTQFGARQRVDLDQEHPHPVIASAWSRAQDVSGSPSPGYSIYLDFIFQDGTAWWMQTANFSTGTHDWEERRFIAVPQKPIRTVYVYCIFRSHTGTVYFDDVNLIELRDETYMFEGVPVRPQPVRAPVEKVWIPYMQTRNGLQMALERNRARVCGVWINQERVGLNGPGFFVRDAAAASDFLAPWNWNFNQRDSMLVITGEVEPLDIRITASMTPREDRIQINGSVEDLRGEQRAITLYFGIPVDDSEWIWADGPRNEIPATATVYTNTSTTVAGATGHMSRFPLGAIYRDSERASAGNRGVAMAVPLHDPRHYRIGLDARTGLFYIAFDFGLGPNATTTPGKATFSFDIFPFPARWGFRSALAAYYRMYPTYYERRAPLEGLWLPKTHVTQIEGAQDFSFAYHTVRDNIGLQAQPGLISLIHSDPTNVWVPMPQNVPRTVEGAIAYVQNQSTPNAEQVAASGLRDITDRQVVAIRNQPWCDGAAFAVNPDPKLPGRTNKGKAELEAIVHRLGAGGQPMLMAWSPLEGGYAIDDSVVHSGQRSIRAETTRRAPRAGAGQRVTIEQTEPNPLELRGYVRTRLPRRGRDDACTIALTLTDEDGGAIMERVHVGREASDFVQISMTLTPEKPIVAAALELLLQEDRGATAWFDDFFLGETGSDINLLQDGGMEADSVTAGGMAGVYIENIGGWGTTMNHNAAHFSHADLPLVYDKHTHSLGVLNMFSTYEYLRILAQAIRERGGLIMASDAFGFPMHLIDIMAVEIDWCRNGRWHPATDESMIMQRALANQKPITLLMNTDFDSFFLEPIETETDPRFMPDEEIERKPSLIMAERYFQRALFYAMYPGFFSQDRATNAFFENPDWYNRVRPLYKKYLPLIHELSQIGWEPITGAVTEESRIYLERYGHAAEGNVYIAARYGDQRWRRDADDGHEMRERLTEPITAEIDVNLAVIGLLGRDNIEVFDMLEETPLETRTEQSSVHYTITLPPHATHLVRIRPAS